MNSKQSEGRILYFGLIKDLWLQMDRIALNGPDVRKDCLKPWNWWKFSSKNFEKYFQMDNFIYRRGHRSHFFHQIVAMYIQNKRHGCSLFYPLPTDFLIDGCRIGLFREARITTGWLLSERNSRKCNLI